MDHLAQSCSGFFNRHSNESQNFHGIVYLFHTVIQLLVTRGNFSPPVIQMLVISNVNFAYNVS